MSTFSFAAAQPDVIPPLWRILTKFLYFTALATAIGGVWVYASIVRPALKKTAGEDSTSTVSAHDADVLRTTMTRVAAFGVLLLGLVAYFQLAARVARSNEGMAYSDALAPSAIMELLRKPAKDGEWISSGALTTAQNLLIVALVLMIVPLLFKPHARAADRLLTIAAPLVLAVTLVSSIPTTFDRTLDEWLSSFLIQGHIIGGSLWVGGLMAVGVLALTRKRLTHDAGDTWVVIWQRFGVLALVSVGLVLVSGIWLTWEEVGAWNQFLTTPFGRFLFAKVLLVAGLIAAGAYNQLALMPKIARAQRAGSTAGVFALTLRHFPKVVFTEIVLGIAVLGIVPFLVGSARVQASGNPNAEAPPVDAGLLTLGALLIVTLIASFYATAKASEALGRREGVVATS